MTGDTRDDGPDIPAGDFSAWVHGMAAVVRGEQASDVPCAGCTACCRASQFVLIAPDEHDTLALIPPALLFPAPLVPRGHVLLGYDERGHCPMLVNDRCSIYEHRPRTCRAYDCRVLAATEVEVDDDTKTEIMLRVRAWRFGHPETEDRVRHDAVRAAARYLGGYSREFSDGIVPTSPVQIAGLAVELHEYFLARGGDGALELVAPDAGALRAELERREAIRTAQAPG